MSYEHRGNGSTTPIAGLAGRFGRELRGATAIEYAMVAAGIAGAIVAAVQLLGMTVLVNLYQQIATAMGV
jgi:Flp pilus assembly pilin Flp